jgi:hypothetical protein
MRPPAAVWLYLYERGSLRVGHPFPRATASFSGTLTALNFTENHRTHRGISADWRKADFVIEIERGIPWLMEPKPHTITPSQGVFRVDSTRNPETVWLTDSPAPKLERVVGVRRVSDVDPEFRRFFTKESLEAGKLLHQEYRSVKTVMRVPRKEVGFMEAPDLQARLEAPLNTEVVIDETLDQDDKFAFIYRAKYRA